MRTICFLNTTTFWGGGEKIHLEYALKFKERGYRVVVICAKNSPLYQKAKASDLDLETISLNSMSFLNPFKIQNLKVIFKKKKIDTLVISTSHDLKTGSICAKWVGIENIIYYRVLASEVKDKWINRYIYTNILSSIIVNSEETKRLLLKNMFSTFQYKAIYTVHQGLQLDQYPFFESQKKTKKIVIGNAGRITTQKKQEYFIPIAKKLKEAGILFEIRIAGTGELINKLKTRVKEQDLENEIKFLGFVENIPKFMSEIDIFALTSLWEGFGYVLAEAMVYEKPVIGFNCTSNPELIKDSWNGYLIEVNNLDEYTKKLQQLCLDKDLRLYLGKNGKSFVEENFQLDYIIDEFEKFV